LTYAQHGNLAANVLAALEYLGSNIQTARYIDPANTNNVVSEDCTPTEKASIANAARAARAKRTWEEIVS